MDPMLEIAHGFLKTERKAASRTSQCIDMSNEHSGDIFPEDIYARIEEQVKELSERTKKKEQSTDSAGGMQLYLWGARDERAQEILADVFYANPQIARRLCEIKKELIPGFVHYLAQEAHRYWQIEKSGVEPNIGTKKLLHELFDKYKYVVHETFPDAFELALIEKPEFMVELNKHLRTAHPFSMVLREELEEISHSRLVRLRSDPDARKARMVDEILRIRSRLSRLREMEIGDRDVIDREEKRLAAKEGELKKMIARSEKRRLKGAVGPRLVGEREQEAKPPGRVQPGAEGGPAAAGSPPDPSPESGNYEIRFPPIQAEEMSLFGLALSGGGIRSATFNLGVLQGLADLDLLRRLDYLSGVSGGSHIAAWLAAWIKREPDGIRRVQRWLSPLRSPTPDTDETHPVQFLRRFSNYLAPKKGFLSTDMWSILTIWLRNTILNQIVFVLLMASLLTAPKLIFEALDKGWWLFLQHDDTWIGVLIMILAIGLASLAGMNLHRFDPGVQASIERRKTPFFLWTQFGVWLTGVLGCMVLGLAGASLIFYNGGIFWNRKTGWVIFSVAIMVVLVSLHLSSRAWRLFLPQRPGTVPTVGQKAKGYIAVFLASAVSALVGGAIFETVVRRYEPWHIFPLILFSFPGEQQWQLSKAVVLGPALVLGILSMSMLLLIGLMGYNLPDNRREWWGRMGAMLLIILGLWTTLLACSLWGPAFVLWIITKHHLSIPVSMVWLTITALGSRWGFSSQTPPAVLGKLEAKPLPSILRTVPRKWIALIAPYVYIAGLAMMLSYVLYAIPGWIDKSPTIHNFAGNSPSSTLSSPEYWYQLSIGSRPWLLPTMFCTMLAVAAILAWRFDINEFSMHSFYKNRLVRCYLGASRAGQRNPNPFTGFDSEDDMRLSLLRVDPPVPKDLNRAARPYRGPFPIFNTTLNLVAGRELAWQDRKAASFVFTPLHCGFEFRRETAYDQEHLANFGYRQTVDYAEPDSLGPALGTSMATSGAAVNPNMGYHSSPAVSFLMALFNARLGCWMGNPRHRTTWRLSSPRAGLAYLVNELIGGTNDTSRFVNLSDGGHFENLGIYELVRRHCKYIIVCDAEEDLPFSFPGLANAIRKCRADFGIDIRLDPDQLRPVFTTGGDQGRSRAHCAVGDIVYSAQTTGKLLYIKTSLTGDEPGDVLSYKLHYSAFPHQSTLNQFFDESQFESYRALGLHIAMAILQRSAEYNFEDTPEHVEPEESPGEKKVCALCRDANNKFLKKVFQSLNAMWYPPTTNMVTLRDRHRELYDQLIEMFRTSDKESLVTAACTFFRTQDPRGPFLAYSKMIELMHRVFQDLDLEIMVDHPYNEGWMNMFRGWAGDRGFRIAWEAARDNYDNRFRDFCHKELNLELGVQGDSREKPAA
jgi:hypothetical protein